MGRVQGASIDASLATRVSQIQCSILMAIKFEVYEKKDLAGRTQAQWFTELYEKKILLVKLDSDVLPSYYS